MVLPRPRWPWLPDPNESDVTNAPAFVATNGAVERMLDKEETASGEKRGSYHAYSVMVAASRTGCLYVFNSHSHGPNHGALVAISSSTATNANVVTYLSQFFNNHFGLGSQLILPNDRAVTRQFHYVFLTAN